MKIKLASCLLLAGCFTGFAQTEIIKASSHKDPFSATLAYDGDAQTFWSSANMPTQEKPQWLALSFDAPKKIETLQFTAQTGYGPRKGEIQVSSDGVNWESVAPITTKNASISKSASVYAAKIGRTTRHIRVVFYSVYAGVNLSNSPRNVQIAELELNAPIIDEAVAFFDSLDLTRKELSEVAAAVKKSDWEAAKAAWAKHLKERNAPHWHWSHRDRKAIQEFLQKNGDDLSGSVKRADKVMRREFSWQNSPRTLEKDVNWTPEDYGGEWGNVLNRHHYWKELGLAWWKTGESKYAQDWVDMMCDWVQENPPLAAWRGPWRTLETGIRTGNWIDTMNMLMDSPAFDAEAKYLFSRSMRDHANVLYEKNKSELRYGNWGQTEATGLFNVSMMFPEFKQAPIWRERALFLLGHHIKNSVFPDGAYCELTPGYHYWMTLSFMKVQTLAKKNGEEIPNFDDHHEKMFEFLMQVSKPNLWTVPLGDAGHGKNIRTIMGVGALLYNRADMRYLAVDEVDPSWIWQFSPEQLASYKTMEKKIPSLHSHIMPHAKYGVMRTGWKPNDRYLLFDCAPWGGFHNHQDRLQVTLYSGRELLVDSGQSHYGNPLSAGYFRKSKAHNVLMIDGQEQPDSDPKVESWNVEDRLEFASGSITNNAFAHQRSVLFVKPGYWVVVDHVTENGEESAAHSLTRLFHLPDVEVSTAANSVQTTYKEGDNLWIGCADDAALEIKKGWMRSLDGKLPQPPVAAFVNNLKLPATLCTVLVPFGKESEIPTLKRLESTDPNQIALEVSFKNGRTDWIAIASKDTDLSVGTHKGKGMALCARDENGKITLDVVQRKPLKTDK